MKPDIDAIRMAVKTVHESNELLLETAWRGLDNTSVKRNQEHRLEVLRLCDYAEELEKEVAGLKEAHDDTHNEVESEGRTILKLTAMLRKLVDAGDIDTGHDTGCEFYENGGCDCFHPDFVDAQNEARAMLTPADSGKEE